MVKNKKATIFQKPYVCKHTEWTGNDTNFVKDSCPNKRASNEVPMRTCRECRQFKAMVA